MIAQAPSAVNSLACRGALAARAMLERLSACMERMNFESYDWWDLWATPVGAWAKGAYVRNRLIGSVLVAPLLLVDILYPGIRRWFAEKRTFPICQAQVGLGYLNLHRLTGDAGYLRKAEALVPALLDRASPMARGLGWGMKHDWVTLQGLVPKDTPCHTQTAYAYELFSALHAATGRQEFATHLERIAAHEANDFPEWETAGCLVSSYSMADTRRVVNANGYRMAMLLDAGERFGREQFTHKGLATLRYVLAAQKDDGSWPYAEDEPFVDTYHTCFVLKNLHRARRFAGALAPQVDRALAAGLRYYFARLHDAAAYPVPFAVKPRIVLHAYDSYDLAESIGLLAELGIEPSRMENLIEFARQRFQTADGWFIFRRYPVFTPTGIPYMRYANSAMFLALTKALLAWQRRAADDPAH